MGNNHGLIMKFGQTTESYFRNFFKKNYAENVNNASYRPYLILVKSSKMPI